MYADQRGFVMGLLEYAPGTADHWRTLPADQLIEGVARDVGGKRADQVAAILRRSVEPQVKLELIRQLLA